ncbi:MAG: glycerol-3-phosphate 1-O-acyltransferase PlsY [Candidatus Rokubacteria bacterium]|nr:glycerol-3-phosphate 1-O-acyltransferase PlsY [Candidatus Rokubacteria bacterium]
MTGGLAVVAAYLVGAVPVGFIVGRAFGLGDVRRHGSGTIGATNLLRTGGKGPALLTLAGDIVKGYAAVALGAWLAAGAPEIVAACAVVAVVGNCWPVFLGFRGGKGVATGLGALLRLVPLAVVPAVAVFLALTLTFRFVSLGSIVGAATMPLSALLFGSPRPSVLACLAVAALIVARHHQNIARLVAGSEHRLGERRSAA